MKNIHTNLYYIIFCAILLATFTGCQENNAQDQTFTSELQSVRKLVLARMTVSKMAAIDDIRLSEAKGLRQTASAILASIKPGTRRAAYSYDTYLRAYINLDQLSDADIQVSNNGKNTDIYLPPITIEYVGRDIGIREDHYRVTGLRSEIDAAERARLKEDMNSVLKEEVRHNPMFAERLKEEAQRKAQVYFKAWGEKHGTDIRIHFKN